MSYDRIFDEVRQERLRQDAKWGPQRHPLGTGGREFIELCKRYREITDQAAADGELTWTHILLEEAYESLAEGHPKMVRAELIQTIAVAAYMIEQIDREAEGVGA